MKMTAILGGGGGSQDVTHGKWEVSSIVQGVAPSVRLPRVPLRLSRLRGPRLPGLQFPPALLCLVRLGCCCSLDRWGGGGGRWNSVPFPPAAIFPTLQGRWMHKPLVGGGEVGPGLGSRGLPP